MGKSGILFPMIEVFIYLTFFFSLELFGSLLEEFLQTQSRAPAVFQALLKVLNQTRQAANEVGHQYLIFTLTLFIYILLLGSKLLRSTTDNERQEH